MAKRRFAALTPNWNSEFHATRCAIDSMSLSDYTTFVKPGTATG
jgi:hypothetical protein